MRKELEPYIKLAPFLGIGLVVVAIALAWILFMQRGAKIELAGSIQKVRTLALDENSAAAIIDFRLRNPSEFPFVVRNVGVTLVDAGGKTAEGSVISETDARRLFEYFPALGQKYNESLLIRTRIQAGRSIDRMIAVRFEVPEKLVAERKGLTVRVEDMSGPVTEVSEH
jgi:hypothetical protein